MYALAQVALTLAPGTSSGFMRAKPPAVRPMVNKGETPIEDPTVKEEGAP